MRTTKPSIAIIGTRDPDKDQVAAAEMLSFTLSRNFDTTIHTGAAVGIDEAAMRRCKRGMLRVYQPWDGYNVGIIPPEAERVVYNPHTHPEWTRSVQQYHPAPDRLWEQSKRLHARNYGVIAGRDLVVAFPRQQGQGGTYQGIRIAAGLGIPVIIRPSFIEFSFEELLTQTLSFSMIVPF